MSQAAIVEQAAAERSLLWDWPVRLVHWSVVLLMPALWWTWRQGNMALHERLGYVLLSLLVFRLFWGFVGASTARFTGFVRGPRAVVDYLRALFRHDSEPVVGHNPLGGWSALALLSLLVAQVVLGLFTQDTDGIESGPLAYLVSYGTADWARAWHGRLFNVLLALIALHVAAILFYLLVKRDNLVGPMLSGRKALHSEAVRPTFTASWIAAVGLAASIGIAWWVSLGCPV